MRCVISAVSLSFSVLPSWRSPGSHALAEREGGDGLLVGVEDGPAASAQHGLPCRGQGDQVPDEYVAGADAVDADQDLPPETDRDLIQRVRQDLFMVGEGVRPVAAGPQDH